MQLLAVILPMMMHIANKSIFLSLVKVVAIICKENLTDHFFDDDDDDDDDDNNNKINIARGAYHLMETNISSHRLILSHHLWR